MIPPVVHNVQGPVVMRRKKRTIIGAVEEVTIRGRRRQVKVLAKVDTGASRTTIDTELAARAGLGPILDTVRIRAAVSEHPETRAVVDADIVIAGRKFDMAVAITDRQDMRFHAIIGMDLLQRSGFLVDPTKVLEAKARKRMGRGVREVLG